MLNASQLIAQYELQPHPEGGFYLQTYCSKEIIAVTALPTRFSGNRYISTAIYFLLEGKQFSAFHRIKSDEIWHFYTGIALHIYVLHPSGKGELLKLGNDPVNGYSFQQMVPAGCWFASKPVNENGFSFAGCTVAPGFDFTDFEMGETMQLLREFPQHEEWIRLLS
ncbi:MAG: cupin domain-containing protein [Chitinophagaceae bacterium]